MLHLYSSPLCLTFTPWTHFSYLSCFLHIQFRAIQAILWPWQTVQSLLVNLLYIIISLLLFYQIRDWTASLGGLRSPTGHKKHGNSLPVSSLATANHLDLPIKTSLEEKEKSNPSLKGYPLNSENLLSWKRPPRSSSPDSDWSPPCEIDPSTKCQVQSFLDWMDYFPGMVTPLGSLFQSVPVLLLLHWAGWMALPRAAYIPIYNIIMTEPCFY